MFDTEYNTSNVMHDYLFELYKNDELIYKSKPIILPIEDKFDKDKFIEAITEEINIFLNLNNTIKNNNSLK